MNPKDLPATFHATFSTEIVVHMLPYGFREMSEDQVNAHWKSVGLTQHSYKLYRLWRLPTRETNCVGIYYHVDLDDDDYHYLYEDDLKRLNIMETNE